MHEKISNVTVLTIIICSALLIFLGSLVLLFLFAYQKKGHRHQQELLVLTETFDKTLLQSKLEIREQTLDHIAKELHANISQLVSVININLSAYLQKSGSEANENIRETKALVKQLMGEVKSLSVTLNTEHVGRAGFQQMLKGELDRLTKTGLFAISFAKTGDDYRLSPENEIILFRLCQEILNNIIRHADATSIDVSVQYSDTDLIVQIADDGVGFDPVQAQKNAERSNSTGLGNIYGRSKQIQGEVVIISKRGEGTSIEVKIPK